MAARDTIRLDITAEDKASEVARYVSRVMEDLEEDPVEVTVKADTSTAETNLEGFARKARAADDSVKGVASSSDQSRSVLANMVGNASQDLGELAGIAGTAGVAVGQIGEYATDGNLALSGLVKTALPMLAIGVAVGIITDKLAKAKREAEETEQALRDAVGAFREGDVGNAAEQMVELFGDLAPLAERAGLNVEDVFTAIADGSGEVAGLEERMVELFERGGDAAHMSADEVSANRDRLAELRIAVGRAAAEWQGANAEMSRTDSATSAAVDALQGLRDEADATAVSFDRLKGAVDMEASFIGAVGDADALAGSLAELARLNGDVTASDEDRSDAARAVAEDTNRLRATVLELVEEYGEIPEEELTRIRAELPAAQQAAFDAWLAEVKEGATVPVRVDLTAALAEAERRLEQWRRRWETGGGGSTVGPGPQMAAPSMVNVTVNAPQGARADDIISAATRYARRNGGRVLTRGRR